MSTVGAHRSSKLSPGSVTCKWIWTLQATLPLLRRAEENSAYIGRYELLIPTLRRAIPPRSVGWVPSASQLRSRPCSAPPVLRPRYRGTVMTVLWSLRSE